MPQRRCLNLDASLSMFTALDITVAAEMRRMWCDQYQYERPGRTRLYVRTQRSRRRPSTLCPMLRGRFLATPAVD